MGNVHDTPYDIKNTKLPPCENFIGAIGPLRVEGVAHAPILRLGAIFMLFIDFSPLSSNERD